MSKWINYKLDSRLVAVPFLQEKRNGGKGLFLNGDIPHSLLLGGGNNPYVVGKFRGNMPTYIGGQSYPQYYRPINYPPFHQPRRKMYYD